VGTVLILATTTAAVTAFPALRHWFMVPITMCGILVIPDAVHWARRRLDTFDPQAMVGVFGTYFFYITPMLHVLLDHWAKYVIGPDDWRAALGEMAILNVLGLIVYRATMAPRIEPRPVNLPATDLRRLCRGAATFAVIGLMAFVFLVASMGGLGTYLQVMADERQELAGLGPVLLVAKSFPTGVLVLVLISFRDFLCRRPATVLLILPVFAVSQMLIGGAGGSRSHTVWSLVIGLGLCHLMVRRVRRRTLAVLSLCLLGFMYFYGFYKDDGTKALEALTGQTSFSELPSANARDLPNVLLADLGRADIQALVLERQRDGTAPLRYGATYIGDLAFLTPDTLALASVTDKVEAGTEMLYGRDSYLPPEFKASQIYGLAGEAVLNFGPAGAVVAFLPFGLVMRRVTAFHRRCLAPPESQGLQLLAPGLALGATLILSSDLDNVAWFFLNQVAVVAILAVVATSRLPGSGGHQVRGRRTAAPSAHADAGTPSASAPASAVPGLPAAH
jgi:hypothetical protein